MEEIFFCPCCMAKTAPIDGKCPVCGCDVNVENAPHQLPVNTILYGRYLVGRVLNAGSFGITYIGYDLKLDGRVAIKEYYPSGAANRSVSLTVYPTTEGNGNPFETGMERFVKEARALSGFAEDSGIVTLRDYFEENGTAYFVMEYLEGENLSHYAARHRKFTFNEALDLLEPTMLALGKVHEKGLIHRDICPSNLMLLNDGRIKVLDFGAARPQSVNGELSLSILIKLGYSPIEQYSEHGEQGPWTDVYAMSATIYKLITGKTPPPSTDRTCGSVLELPSALGAKITPAQEKALMRGLALHPADRTQTMAELAESLRAADSAHEIKPEEPKAPEKKDKPAKRALPKKRLITIGTAVLAVLALCLTLPSLTETKAEGSSAKADTGLATPVKTEPTQTPKPELSAEELTAARDAIAAHSETTIGAGNGYSAGVMTDGTVVTAGLGSDYADAVKQWTDIMAVGAGSGEHILGLRSDGTVVAAGDDQPKCRVDSWTDIVAVSAGANYSLGLKADGTVVGAGYTSGLYYYGELDVGSWTDIVAVDAGFNHTVGLKSDGTVVAVGSNNYGQCDVSGWKDIIAVSAGCYHTVGLKADGTVVAAGRNEEKQLNVRAWKNIVAVSAGDYHTVGLRADGTVVAAGSNSSGQCDVDDWSGITAISAAKNHTLGLRTDGTAVAVGLNQGGQCGVSYWHDLRLPLGEQHETEKAEDTEPKLTPEELAAAREAIAPHKGSTIAAGGTQSVAVRIGGTAVATEFIGEYHGGQCNVGDWTNIIAVSAGGYHTVGLKADGTVVAVGSNREYGQCNVGAWRDIVAISAGSYHTVGLKSDGTVVAVGYDLGRVCDVDSWTDIVAVSAGSDHTVGLKADGTVVATGSNLGGQCEGVAYWRDIIAVSAGSYHTVGLKADGTVVAVGDDSFGRCDVSDWKNIVAVSVGEGHTVGLRADGTVVATGYNKCGQCNVSAWRDIVAISAGAYHTIGLKADGTVVSTEFTGTSYEYCGQCEVSGWQNIMIPGRDDDVVETGIL